MGEELDSEVATIGRALPRRALPREKSGIARRPESQLPESQQLKIKYYQIEIGGISEPLKDVRECSMSVSKTREYQKEASVVAPLSYS